MTSRIAEITRTIEVKEEGVVLEMSIRDAVVLARILDNVGGEPEGYRGSADRIGQELYPILANHDVRFFDGFHIRVDGRIMFRSTESDVSELDKHIEENFKE